MTLQGSGFAQSDAELQTLIESLGAAKHSTRNSALAKLQSYGKAAESALETASKSHDDLEVRTRAGILYRDFQWGLYPGTPSYIIKAIRSIRSDSLQRKQIGLHELMEAQRFDLVLSAVKLQPARHLRYGLASLALQSSLGQTHFLKDENLWQLLAATKPVGEEQEVATKVAGAELLFTPTVINAIVQTGQIDRLLDFSTSLPDEEQFLILRRVLTSDSAVKSFCADGDSQEVFRVIARGKTKLHRTQLAMDVANSASRSQMLIRTGTLLKLLDLIEDQTTILRRVFASPITLLELVQSTSAKEVVQLLDRFKQPADRIYAGQQLCSLMNYHRARGAIANQLDAALNEIKDAEFRSLYVVAKISQSRTQASSREELIRLLSELSDLQIQLEVNQLESIVNHCGHLLLSLPESDWLLEQLAGRSEKDQVRVLSRMRTVSVSRMGKVKLKLDSVVKLVGTMLGFQESGNRERAASFVAGLPIQDAEEAEQYFDELSNEFPKLSDRSILLRGFASNYQIMSATVRGDRFVKFAELIGEIESPEDQFKCWGVILLRPDVPKKLVGLNRLDVLLGYENQKLTPTQRGNLLRTVVRSRSCLGELLKAGKFESLEKAIDGIEEDRLRLSVRASFLSSSEVFKRYLDAGNVEVVRTFLGSVPGDQLSSVLSEISSSMKTAESCDALAEVVWQRIEEIPEQQKSVRVTIYNRLLASEAFATWVIAKQRANQLIPDLKKNLTQDQFGNVIYSFLSRGSAKKLLAHVSMDDLLNAVYGDLDDSSRNQFRTNILNASELLKHAEETKQLDKLYQRWVQLADRDPKLSRGLFGGPLAALLIKNGWSMQLLELAKREQGSRRGLGQLVRDSNFSREYLAKHPASEMLSLIAPLTHDLSESADSAYLVRTLLTSSNWTAALAQQSQSRLSDELEVLGTRQQAPENESRSELDYLRVRLLNERPSEMRDSIVVGWLTSTMALAETTAQQTLELMNSITDPGAAITQAWRQILISPVATYRLCQIGQFEKLHHIAAEHEVSEFFALPFVVTRLKPEQQQAAFDQLEKEIESGRLFYSSNWQLLPPYVRTRGLKKITEETRNPTQLNRIWTSTDALLAVIERGEMKLLSDAIGERYRRMLLSNISRAVQSRRGSTLLSQKENLDSFLSWVESHEDDELRSAGFLQSTILQQATRQNGIGERYKALLKRAFSKSSVTLQKRFQVAGELPVLILQGKIQEAERILRESSSPTATADLVGFLFANGLAEKELAALSAKRSNEEELSRDEQLRHVLLLRALQRHKAAVEIASGYGLDGLATAIKIELHNWIAAAKMTPPTSSQLPVSAPTVSESIERIEAVTISGRLAAYAGEGQDYLDAIEELKKVAAASPDDANAQQMAADGLILLQRVRPGIKQLHRNPWRAARVYHYQGFFQFGFQRVAWGDRSAEEYYQAIAKESEIGSTHRRACAEFMLDLADSLRTIGRYDRANEIDQVLAKYGDLEHDPRSREQRDREIKSYQTWLLGQWIQRGNLQAASRWMEEHPNTDPYAISNETFRNLGPDATKAYGLNRLLQSLQPKMPIQERLAYSLNVVTGGLESESTNEIVPTINRQVRMTLVSPSSSLRVYETAALHWGTQGKRFPLDRAEDHRDLMSRTEDKRVWSAYAVGCFGEGDFQEAAYAFGEAEKLDPNDAAIRYMHGEALIRISDEKAIRERGELLREQALRLAYQSQQRIWLAEMLDRVGLKKDATTQWRILKRTQWPGSKAHFTALSKLADRVQDPQLEIELRRERLVSLCRRTADRSSTTDLIDQAMSVHTCRLLLAAKTQDFETVKRQLVWCRSINPNDTDSIVAAIVALDAVSDPASKAASKSLADEIFLSTRQFYDSRVKVHEGTAQLRLRRAEFCVACGRSLDLAKSDIEALEELPVDRESLYQLKQRMAKQ